MFEDNFENMLKQYDQALSDRKVFVGLIRDLFPEESIRTNLLIQCYDLDIVPEIRQASVLDKAFAYRFIKQLQDDHGISRRNAEWAVSTWCVCYGQNILQKPCSITISTDVSVTSASGSVGRNAANTEGILYASLGIDADGDALIHDFAETPHILICGHSGAGKTCFVQTVLTTMARDHSVDEVGYMIYDSKSTDYVHINNLPHMLAPVISDAKQFEGALQWAKVVTQKRYYLFAEKQVKNLNAYNKKSDEKLPHFFIVIDDLYNLLFSSGKALQDSLKYLLVNGRQAGIHFVIVTSMPSSKVLQTEILANLPCRICFAVASKQDSRTILGVNGAEELDVPGQMIFKTQNRFVKCRAVHMTEEEILDTIAGLEDGASWSDPGMEGWLRGRESASDNGSSAPEGYDPMLPQAVEIVMDMGSCSVSNLQKRIKLGYSRAARIVDQMEELGIVGPYEGAKPRTVLIDRKEWRNLCVKLGYITQDTADDQSEDEEQFENSATRIEITYAKSPPTETNYDLAPSSPSGDYPKLVWSKKKKKPFWLRFVRAVAIVFGIFVVIGMIITLTDKGESVSLPASGGAKAVSQQAAGAAPIEAGEYTIVIPAHLVYDGSYHAEHVHFAEEYGLSSLEKNKDGSITMISESNIPDANVDALVAALSEECKESGYTRFVSVAVNEDHTLFTIHVNDINIYEKERQAITDMFLMAGLEAVQKGRDVDIIRVEIVNSQGKVISMRETNK